MDVAGYTATFARDQGSVLSNDQMSQALYNAPLNTFTGVQQVC